MRLWLGGWGCKMRLINVRKSSGKGVGRRGVALRRSSPSYKEQEARRDGWRSKQVIYMTSGGSSGSKGGGGGGGGSFGVIFTF